MAQGLDPSEFVDTDYEAARREGATGARGSDTARAPTREEVDAQATDLQAELARLKQAQEQLERERAQLDETKRRQTEWKTGREEMIHALTRGIGLLEEAEFSARQEAEQTSKSIGGLRDALAKVQAVSDETWTKDNFQVEMTKALTTLENARMEWNSARLKHAVLSGKPAAPEALAGKPEAPGPTPLAQMKFLELCRLGLALTWPVALVLAVVALALLARAK